MFLVGVLRLAFNTTVNRTFGLEANGHAAALISIVMLATLPSTASIPPVMVRHMSRAIAAGRHAEARAHARLASLVALVLAVLAIPVAAMFNELSRIDLVIVSAGVLSLAYWRLYRSLFLTVGRAAFSLKMDLAATLAMPALLIPLILFDLPAWAAAAFFAVYVAYAALTSIPAMRELAGEHLPMREVGREFLRYNVLNAIGTATSLAAREIAVLVVKERETAALVGELAYALSVLSLLNFAPRILELPMLSELGQRDLEKQRALTERASHVIWIMVFAGGCGAAILAPVILPIGEATSPVIAVAFVVMAFAFMSEIIQSPATNLIFSEAHPGILASIGVTSLLGALAWWYVPAFVEVERGLIGVVIGLAISHAIKAIGIGVYARLRFAVRTFTRPILKLSTTAVGLAAVTLSLRHQVSPFIAFLVFESVMLAAFHQDARAMLRSLRR